MSLTKESVRYFIGRKNIDTGIEEVVHTSEFTDFFMVSGDFEQSRGFDTFDYVDKIATYFNKIEEEVALYNNRQVKHQYFAYRRDDKITVLTNSYPSDEELETKEE